MKYPFKALELSPVELHKHELNDFSNYKDERSDRFTESIKQHGILQPIIVNSNKKILSGQRRWIAACELKMDTVPVLQITKLLGPKEERRIIVESNLMQRQMSRIAFSAYWNELYYNEVKEKLKKGKSTSEVTGEIVKKSELGWSRNNHRVKAVAKELSYNDAENRIMSFADFKPGKEKRQRFEKLVSHCGSLRLQIDSLLKEYGDTRKSMRDMLGFELSKRGLTVKVNTGQIRIKEMDQVPGIRLYVEPR